jgi:hypothetical protein
LPCRHPVVLPSGFCPTHDADHHVSRLFGAGPEHTTGYQLPSKPKTLAVLAELVEQQMEAIIAPYLAGLTAKVVIQTEDGAVLTDIEDWQTRLKTAETLLDRTSGKPKQAVDMQHDVGETLAELLAPTPLEATHTRLPETGWEGTDG